MGLGVAGAAWLLLSGLDEPLVNPDTGEATTPRALLETFRWSRKASWALLATAACILTRDLAYIWRIRVLSLGKLSWRSSFNSIMLWECASAVTPTIVGGSAVAIWVLTREGLTVGRSLATVFVTAMMDELFYLIAVPIVGVLIWYNGDTLFPTEGVIAGMGKWAFLAAYSLLLVLSTIIIMGVLVAPSSTRKLLIRITSFSILKRWQTNSARWGDELVLASESLKGAPRSMWIRAMGAIILSWSARFATLNMIALIFYSSVPHVAVFGRQLIMWITLMVSPTPGSTGIAEIALPAFLGELLGMGYIAVLAICWRLATYFPYLLAGALVFPGWLRRTAR